MATKSLREGKKITFADGKERVVYPLTIRQLRKFIKAMKELQTDKPSSEMSDDEIDLMVQAASIALEKVDPDLAADLEGLEDVLDIKIFNELLAAAMGADPNV